MAAEKRITYWKRWVTLCFWGLNNQYVKKSVYVNVFKCRQAKGFNIAKVNSNPDVNFQWFPATILVPQHRQVQKTGHRSQVRKPSLGPNPTLTLTPDLWPVTCDMCFAPASPTWHICTILSNFEWYILLNNSSTGSHRALKLCPVVYLLLWNLNISISWLNLLNDEWFYFLLVWHENQVSNISWLHFLWSL